MRKNSGVVIAATVCAIVVLMALATSLAMKPAEPDASSVSAGGGYSDRPRANYAPSDLLHPNRVIGTEDTFGFVTTIEVVADWLIAIDVKPLRENQLLVLDRTSGAVVYETGRFGQGPNDLGQVATLAWIPETRARFILNDYSNGRLLVYDLDEWTGAPELSIRQPDAPLIYEVEWLPGGTVVANGQFSDGLLRLYDVDEATRTSQLSATVGTLWFPTQPQVISTRLSQNEMAVHPSGERIVLASVWTNRLQLHDKSGELLRVFGGPEDVIPRFIVRNRTRVIPDLDAGYGPAYLDVATSQDYILALFSGQPESDDGLGREIHVFDWQGDLAHVFGLAEGVAYIATGPNGRTLYGVRGDPYPAILEYTLPLTADPATR